MILHILNKNYTSELLNSFMQRVQAQDGLVLLADAVYILSNANTKVLLSNLIQSKRLYVLSEELKSRGLSLQNSITSQNPSNIEISYTQFVELTLQFDKTLTW